MEHAFHGIPTVPPRRDMSHMVRREEGGGKESVECCRKKTPTPLPHSQAFFCRGCRYRVTAFPDWTAARVSGMESGGLKNEKKPSRFWSSPYIPLQPPRSNKPCGRVASLAPTAPMTRGRSRVCAGGRTWCVCFFGGRVGGGGLPLSGKRKHTPSHTHLSLPIQTLIYAGQPLDNDKRLADYGVPPVRVCVCFPLAWGVGSSRLVALSPPPSSLTGLPSADPHRDGPPDRAPRCRLPVFGLKKRSVCVCVSKGFHFVSFWLFFGCV